MGFELRFNLKSMLLALKLRRLSCSKPLVFENFDIFKTQIKIWSLETSLPLPPSTISLSAIRIIIEDNLSNNLIVYDIEVSDA